MTSQCSASRPFFKAQRKDPSGGSRVRSESQSDPCRLSLKPATTVMKIGLNIAATDDPAQGRVAIGLAAASHSTGGARVSLGVGFPSSTSMILCGAGVPFVPGTVSPNRSGSFGTIVVFVTGSARDTGNRSLLLARSTRAAANSENAASTIACAMWRGNSPSDTRVGGLSKAPVATNAATIVLMIWLEIKGDGHREGGS
jgi:hypothetical protein